ncbi:MAG: conserved rane protein of unknown function [Modestobacter sp.]|nr:conserved rane protein of unknown function [Modestobacter sp.]HEV7872195.1 DUF4190 domain-containing protein [Modestobacter sp.]
MSQPADDDPGGRPTSHPGTPHPSPPSSAPPWSTPGYGPPPGAGTPSPYGPQPGYGPPPGHPPQAYGQPGWGPGLPRPTNTLAILALVLAFVFAPAGLVLGIVARRQIRQTGEEGDGLALAGIIIGAIVTAMFALAVIAWVVAFASIVSSDGFAP